jgi:VWFA-related protein
MKAKANLPLKGLCIAALVTLPLLCAFWTPKRDGQKPGTVVQVTTLLIQASVVVVDKNGRPVTGLKREDFALQVDGKARGIGTFAEETAQAPGPPEEPLPPGIYSNELARKPGVPHSLTAILFDSLNTQFWDQLTAGRSIIEFLSQIQPQDRVAIFSLGRNFRVLHDFSSDSSSLVQAIEKFRSRPNWEIDASRPESYQTGNPVIDGIFEKQGTIMASYYACERMNQTWTALEMIADYMSAIPGRKNLIWVSAGFPFPYDMGKFGCKFTSNDVLQICRAVSNANMSLYPVDARGLVGPNDIVSTFNASYAGRGPGGMPQTVLNSFVVFTQSLQTMRMLADRTGGRAFYNANDLTNSIRRAVDDSGNHYMLGFYPLEKEWNKKFHSIKVTVSRPGAEVRYRQGFYALPEPLHPAKDRMALALDAARSPLEISRMSLMVRLDPSPALGASLKFEVVVDPHQLTLDLHENLMTGSLYISFLQCTMAGKILLAKHETVNLRLNESTYRKALESGLSLSRELPAEPGAEQLRIGICDGVSDNTGSIVIPLPKGSTEPVGSPARR